MPLSEEGKVFAAEKSNYQAFSAYNFIPYALISEEVGGDNSDILTELNEIAGYYKIYRHGATFSPEGSNGDYVPSELKYKMAASLIDKEARFLFSETPTITVEPKNTLEEQSADVADNFSKMNEMVNAVLESNNFGQQILRAARDCFIGKRIAVMVNFNETDGVTVSFLPATQFVYEYDYAMKKLVKFVAYVIVHQSAQLSARRIFRKRYTLEDDVVYVQEDLFDGAGNNLMEITPHQDILLDRIPATVILNDGLLGDYDGESEIANLKDYEEWYSKLSNADIDAERKGMNQIKYAIDMDPNSTKNLSTAPGSFWDLGSDQNLPNPHSSVGTLNPSMSYSEPLTTTLERIKTTGYEQVDMPNITLESMQGAITSGKALKAVYWPLIIRCKEKMKTWAPHLSDIISIIIDGASLYPDCMQKYISELPMPSEYNVIVEQSTPLPEDETEEKSLDISEVAAQVLSKKSYMKKWRGLTDRQVDAELIQIAYERQLLEDAAMPGQSSDSNIIGEGEGGPITENQHGYTVTDGSEDNFAGDQTPSDQTTGDDSSRTLSDKYHV